MIGTIRKLKAELFSPIEYKLPIGDEVVSLNELLGKKMTLKFLGEINCIQCQRKTTKSFQQGYCFPCYRHLLECNLCIIHPERCRYPEIECPNNWAHASCSQPHIVYLANSSDLKVGITRETQIPIRWIDQGALQAMPIFKVTNRKQAGLLEVILKQFVGDKTNWRRMISENIENIDLKMKMNELLVLASQPIKDLQEKFENKIEQLSDPQIVHFHYPILKLPTKIQALNFEKTPIIEGQLLGIKGQYLLLDIGVINIRKYGGYKIEFS